MALTICHEESGRLGRRMSGSKNLGVSTIKVRRTAGFGTRTDFVLHIHFTLRQPSEVP